MIHLERLIGYEKGVVLSELVNKLKLKLIQSLV